MVQQPRGASGGTSASADLSFAGGGALHAVLCMPLREQRIKDPQNFALEPFAGVQACSGNKFGFYFSHRRKTSAFFFLLSAHLY